MRREPSSLLQHLDALQRGDTSVPAATASLDEYLVANGAAERVLSLLEKQPGTASHARS